MPRWRNWYYAKDLKSFGRNPVWVRAPPAALPKIYMGMIFKKHINQDFFKSWNPIMSYVLGYIVADGAITVSKDRKNHPFTLNITSAEKGNIERIKRAMVSEHKIGKKYGSSPKTIAYQLAIRNPVLTEDLINLGILPRKTYNLNIIKVPEKYFSDFVRGFFDGDGTVYIYKVNNVFQIKAGFVSTSLDFITDFNQRLCKNLDIPLKNIHQHLPKRKGEKLIRYCFDLYIDDCQKFANFIYKDNPILYLPRKRKIFEEWKLIKRRSYIKQKYPSKIGWQLNQKVLIKN